jgi:tellurite resistance protein TerC
MYFLLADLIHRFVYLKVGLALVLVWVGVKMLLKVDLFYIPTTVSLAVITAILTVSVVASLRATRGQSRRALQPPTDPPFRAATAEELAALEPLWRRGRADGAPAATPGSSDTEDAADESPIPRDDTRADDPRAAHPGGSK